MMYIVIKEKTLTILGLLKYVLHLQSWSKVLRHLNIYRR